MRRPVAARAAARALLAVGLWTGCAGPVVDARLRELEPAAWRRIAVVPFQPAADYRGSLGSGEPAAVLGVEAASLVTRIATEAFSDQGFDMVPASDLAGAYRAAGERIPHGDPAALGRRASLDFGASAVMVGTVREYRARSGGELGSSQPARVDFALAVHEARSGRLLWSAHFEHTQRAFAADPFLAWGYPGRGSRWLSAAELARWGADRAALAARERRP